VSLVLPGLFAAIFLARPFGRVSHLPLPPPEGRKRTTGPRLWVPAGGEVSPRGTLPSPHLAKWGRAVCGRDSSQTHTHTHTHTHTQFASFPGQVAVIALCALLLKTRQVGLLCAPLLPLAARLCCLPAQALPTVSSCGAVVAALQLLYGAASYLLGLLRTAAAGCQEILQDPEAHRLVSLAGSLWRRLAVPLVFSAFWLALFALQILTLASSSSSSSSGHFLAQQGWIFLFLGSVAKCCSTPYSLIGLTCTVSYLALGMLQLARLYLTGYGAFQDGSVTHRGVTEGVTLLLLAIQTGLLDLQLLQRTYLLTVIFFIVATSTLQSVTEIAEPVVLGLGASQNSSRCSQQWNRTVGKNGDQSGSLERTRTRVLHPMQRWGQDHLGIGCCLQSFWSLAAARKRTPGSLFPVRMCTELLEGESS
uniref:TRC8-like N-terminal domain-containing protein n=1 Tax=Laticauda laticaudata TaxID=8630 RepID=A0A8C5RYA3_LATLA